MGHVGMGESSLRSFCPLFDSLRRAPPSGEAELEMPRAGAGGLVKVTLGHLQLTLPAPAVGPAGLGHRPLPPCPVASSIPCHTPGPSQVYSPGVDLGVPTVKEVAGGRKLSLAFPRSGQLLSWGGAAFIGLGV